MEPTDHEHVWVPVTNSLGLVCQICQWRKNPTTGEILPPDPNMGAPITG